MNVFSRYNELRAAIFGKSAVDIADTPEKAKEHGVSLGDAFFLAYEPPTRVASMSEMCEYSMLHDALSGPQYGTYGAAMPEAVLYVQERLKWSMRGV